VQSYFNPSVFPCPFCSWLLALLAWATTAQTPSAIRQALSLRAVMRYLDAAELQYEDSINLPAGELVPNSPLRPGARNTLTQLSYESALLTAEREFLLQKLPI
jgi:hypothetical protein